LIDYAARTLGPVSLVQSVAKHGLAVMESVYPEQSAETQSIAGSRQNPEPVVRKILDIAIKELSIFYKCFRKCRASKTR
jgi:hypothetical protein